MAYITIPSRRILAPTYPVQLRPEFEYNLLSFLSPLLVGHQDSRLLTYGTSTRGAARGKPGWTFANSATDVITNTDAGLNVYTTSSALTFMCSVTVRATVGGAQTLGSFSAASVDRQRVVLTDTNNTATANSFGSSNQSATTGSNSWAYGVTAQIGGVFAGVASRVIYVNGTGTSSTANCGASDALTDMEYGSLRGTNNLDGTLHYAGFWQRAWTAAEVADFQRYPYMWVAEYTRPVYFLAAYVAPAGGFGAYFANSANTMIQTPTT